jgi:uncharacterized protein
LRTSLNLRRTILLLSALMLTDCGTSPKTHYFILTAVPGEPQAGTVAAPVTVASVHVPASLDRQEMVHLTGATTVEVRDQDRWTATLGDMARTVLSEDLMMRLPPQGLVLPDAPAPPKTKDIVVTITQFAPTADSVTMLQGSWTLLQNGRPSPLVEQDIDLKVKGSARDGNGQAAAMSQLLGQLADHIAAELARPP